MKFKRIEDNKIRCVISDDELIENGMSLEDFVNDQMKTQDFVRKVLEDAYEVLEIDESEKARAYTVQITIDNDGVTLIIIPEKAPSNAGIGNAIQELKKHLEKMQNKMHETRVNEINDKASELLKEASENIEGNENVGVRDALFWAAIDELDDAIKLCKQVPKYEGVKTTLYKYRDVYYLKIDMEGYSSNDIASVLLVVSEYSKEVFVEEYDGAMIEEHGDVMCEDCFEKLAKI